MHLRIPAAALALALMLASCGPGGDQPSATGNADDQPLAAGNMANPAANGTEAGNSSAGPQISACPFRRTRDWNGSVEGGHVRINGYVDLQMAGFRPALTERSGAAAGTIALDLALAPAPGEPVSDLARYERRGAPAYRRAEIWCGGERIQQIDMVVVQ